MQESETYQDHEGKEDGEGECTDGHAEQLKIQEFKRL
jgi:hypothetical protein